MKNISKKNMIIIASGLLSANAFSQAVELHDMNNAASSYSNFKAGTGSDPFSAIDSGYKERYLNEITTDVDAQKSKLTETFIDSSEYNVITKLKKLSSSESETLTSIYKSNFDEDGMFNAEAYAYSYETFMDSKRSSREVALNEHYNGMIDTISQGDDLSIEYGLNVKADISNAQNNLISLISTESSNRKANLNNILVSASERSGNYSPLISETQILANQFADCGSACVIPEPVVIEPIEPPVITGVWTFQSGNTTSNCGGGCTTGLLSANPETIPAGTCDIVGKKASWTVVMGVNARAQSSTLYTSQYTCI
jgi:hypothetical protein